MLVAAAIFSISKQNNDLSNCSQELSSTVIEARAVCDELEEMMVSVVNISKDITEEIDSRLNSVKSLSAPPVLTSYAETITPDVYDNTILEPEMETDDIKTYPGRTMNKMRVYELAREVGLPNKELIQIIKELGIKISNHMNCLNEEQIRMVKKVLDSGASDKVFDRLLRQEMKGREERAEEVMPAAEEAAAIRMGFSIDELKTAHPYIAVRTMYENGYSIRQIAQILDRGQGEISLILNLAKRKQACI